MTGCLDGWVVGQLASWLVGWLAGQLVSWLGKCLINCFFVSSYRHPNKWFKKHTK
jgi:hypothetical protein